MSQQNVAQSASKSLQPSAADSLRNHPAGSLAPQYQTQPHQSFGNHRLSSALPTQNPMAGSQVMRLEDAFAAATQPNQTTLAQSLQNRAPGWLKQGLQGMQQWLGNGHEAAVSSLPQTQGPLIGIIDTGFAPGQHGNQMLKTIQSGNPEATILLADSVGKGTWADSLTQFVDTAKATGQTRAVVNASFDLTQKNPDGSITTRQELTAQEKAALNYARENGVLVVASAGNEGKAMSALGQASGLSDNLIVVGSAEGNDRASYSSYGNGLDLVTEVGSAGTSLAAAKVTGAIANIWSANPELSGQQVNQILTATATDLKTSGRDAETGAGLLNSTGAIDLAKHTTPEAIVFSGAQLVQPVPESLAGAAWESRDGAVASERTAGFGDWLKDNAHGVLDVAGFIPVVGAVADVANAGLYAAEGDYANAALSAAAAVPGIGDAAAAAKLANRGVRAVQAANRGARATERATSAARAIPPRPSRPPAPRPTSPSRATRPSGERSLPSEGRRHSAAPRPTSSSRSRRPESGTPSAAPGWQQPALDRGNIGRNPKSQLENSPHSSRGISGQRRPNTTRIGDEDITRLTREFEEVGGNPNDFRIVQGGATHYDDATNKVNVGGNIFPNPHSSHPRSIMSTRATLAHELGHQAYRGTSMKPGDWRDEFRASYHAARHSPGLSDKERFHLIEDAIMRAKEAGATINANKNAFIARTRGFPYTPRVAYKAKN